MGRGRGIEDKGGKGEGKRGLRVGRGGIEK